jgi:S-adenosyl-L-methionine hydrolase (adenosine-forming)
LTVTPIITFLSDYGLSDDFVGVCHGVIATICPEARVIDLTHGVPRGDVRAGALILRQTVPYLPVGVHVAVVDPGVGSDRRAVAVKAADDRVLVGPDNGILPLAAAAAGGAVEAVDIGRSPFVLEPVSATFHGRDVFAPVAARLARGGVALADAGDPLDPDGLVALELPRARLDDGVLVTHAIYADRFGNVQLDADDSDLDSLGLEPGQGLELRVAGGRPARARYVRTFADANAGQLLLYLDSYQRLAVAVNQGSAASRLGVAIDDELRIRPV